MTLETKEEKRVESEAKVEPKVCEFTGYLREDGKIVLKPTSEECRKAIVEAGAEMGIDVELEEPVKPCEPCKEAAKRWLTAMRARRVAKEAEHANTVEKTAV